MELPVTNLILLCVFYPRNLFLKKNLKYKYAGVTKQFYNAFNSSSSELLKVPLPSRNYLPAPHFLARDVTKVSYDVWYGGDQLRATFICRLIGAILASLWHFA